MHKWAQGLKQWSLWLVGEASMPDRTAGLMLAATVLVVALLGAGAAFALKPSPPAKSARRTQAALIYRAALARRSGSKSGNHHAKVTHHRKKKSKSAVTKRLKESEYDKAVALALADGSHKKSTRGVSASGRVKHRAHRHVNTGRDKSHASAAPSTSQAVAAGAAIHPDVASILAPVLPAPSPTAPTSPTIVGTVSNLQGSRVTWSAPADDGSSPVTGYNLYMGLSPGAQYSTPVNGSRPISGHTYVVGHVIAGTKYSFTVRAINAIGISPPSNQVSTIPPVSYSAVGQLAPPVVAMASDRAGTGYWLANSAGAISANGSATDYGSTANVQLNAPIIEIVATPDGDGYWEVASDGGVFAYGDAGFFGSMGGQTLNAPIVGLASTADGQGYWEVASDGGVFAFGDARFAGSMGGRSLDQPIVGMALDRATAGYWEVGAGGQVYAFGGARDLGSPAQSALHGTIVGIGGAPAGRG